MGSSLAALENRWVVDAMITSLNHVHEVRHNARYEELGPIGVSDRGKVSSEPAQIEFTALDDDPAKVVKAIRKYKTKDGNCVLTVFHEMLATRDIKTRYARHNLEFLHTQPILGVELPAPNLRGEAVVRIIKSREQADSTNRQLSVENESIPLETLMDMHIHNLVAEKDDHVAGWAQLVTAFSGVGFIHQLFTLSGFRNQRVGSTLLTHVHEEAERLGMIRMALVPSDTAFRVFRRFGYSPLAYFTVFRPND
ncbi:MAG: GNAT family N-acetyltransferase [Chloroflexi bacterium]|nr:GNAT family N-acetyltransferase [Chloroflexota bacterium]